jgi:L-fuconolactonase
MRPEVRCAWLAQALVFWEVFRVLECVLDPDLPIVDPHHHFYSRNHWSADHSPYLIDEIASDMASGHNVCATVYVECGEPWRNDGPAHLRPVEEVEFVSDQLRKARGVHHPGICAGIVARVDLTLGDLVDEAIDALEEASEGRLRGIRSPTTWDPDPEVLSGGRRFAPKGLMAEARFRDGVSRLARRGLVYDAWQFYPQLTELADLARAVPDATVVAGHCGGLLGKQVYASPENYSNWKAQILELAKCPNVTMKLGGLANDRTGFGFQARNGDVPAAELIATWSPYIMTCIEAFGADRCMFESNFPVDRSATDYRTLWNVFKAIVAQASLDEKQLLFAGCAQRVYNLG